LEPTGGSLEILADIYAKHVQHIPWIGGALAALTQGAAEWIGATRFGKRVVRSTSRVFPYGYFVVAARANS
jgi:hypothetical protein